MAKQSSPYKILYFCHECNTQAVVFEGRVTVPHKLDCEFANALYVRYPSFSTIGSF